MDNIKQVIVVRKDIIGEGAGKMGCGKLAAQVAHASTLVLLKKMQLESDNCFEEDINIDSYALTLYLNRKDYLTQWLEGDYKKIVLYVKNESQLLKKYQEIVNAGYTATLVKDLAYTTFSEPTLTCFAVEPLPSDIIDNFTKRLQILK